MDNDDRLEMLDEAREHLETAIDLISQAVRGTSEDARANAYIIPHLQSWIDSKYEQITIDSMVNTFSHEGNDE